MENIRYNAERFSALTGKRLCAVVKANAYGHGAEEVVNALSGVADCFAVALIEEGEAIRAAACGKDILVFTPPTDETEGYALAANGFVASVSDLRTARLLSAVCNKYRLPLRVHLKVNTGMNRYGMNPSMLGKVCKLLRGDPFIRVTGIYSHLCECSLARAEKQRALFLRMERICKRYFPAVVAHLGATYGAMLGEKYAFDMVRVGIGLYGYLPCGATEETGVSAETFSALSLKKGMAVYAKTVSNRKLSYGSAGYGKELSEEELGCVSIRRYGYADGFLRKRQNGAEACEKNANELCMDVCIRKGRTRIGRWSPVLTDADEIAKKTGTISYEVLCAATRRAEFVYENDEAAVCGKRAANAKGKKGDFARVREETAGGERKPRYEGGTPDRELL